MVNRKRRKTNNGLTQNRRYTNAGDCNCSKTSNGATCRTSQRIPYSSISRLPIQGNSRKCALWIWMMCLKMSPNQSWIMERSEQRQHKSDWNGHWTTAHLILCHNQARPKVHVGDGWIDWLHYHKTNVDMTTLSVNLANKLQIASKCMNGRLMLGMNQSIDTANPNNCPHPRGRQFPICQAWRLTPNVTNMNMSLDKSCPWNNPIHTQEKYCYQASNTVQY